MKPLIRRTIAAVIAVLFLILTACTITSAIAATRVGSDAASKPPTEIIKVSPVNNNGTLRSSYHVTATHTGATCTGGSDKTGWDYHCKSPAGTFNPCWASQSKPTVYCVAAPYLHQVTELKVKSYTKTAVGSAAPLDHPWAVQIAQGEKCRSVIGTTHKVKGGYPIEYSCGDGRTVLYGSINTNKARWVVTRADNRAHGTGHYKYAYSGTCVITKAWYGLKSNQA